MVVDHMCTNECETEFSSWSPSLRFILYFRKRFKHEKLTSHISIIDTRKLPGHVRILHAPQLDFLKRDLELSSAKYLVHGIIDGPAYKAVRLEDLETSGMRTFTRKTEDLTSEYFAQGLYALNIERDIADAGQVAALFGESFQAAVFVAVLAVRFEHNHIWMEGVSRNLESTAGALRELSVPEHWVSDPAIKEGVEGIMHILDVKRMLLLMRMLVEFQQKQVTYAC